MQHGDEPAEDPPAEDPPAEDGTDEIDGDDPPTDDVLEGLSRLLDEQPSVKPGESVGGFKVRAVIGRGGMGVVYDAVQEHPRRKVALKVMRGFVHMDESQVRWFRREVAALARLRHRGIVQVYDAGTLGDGRPWLAMERVEGVRLDEWLAQRQRTRTELLHLFLELCECIEHAHRRGVIHRDLKPSNILVEADGQPRVLDFGLARFVDADGQESLATVSGRIAGTLEWMSPEQAANGDVDVRSDVYTLGLLLYRLLTGEHAYPVDTSRILVALQAITTTTPRRRPSLTGDLETVVFKALEKDPERRLPSALALKEEIRRVLDHEPILSRPPTLAYQARLFARRNRAVAAGLAIALLALVGGFAATWSALVRAQVETAKADEVMALLVRSLAGADPFLSGKADRTVLEALQEAERYVDAGRVEVPEVEAALRAVIGNVLVAFGEHRRGIEHHRIALNLREEAFDAPHLEIAESLRDLGFALHAAEELAEAKERKLAALAMRRELLASDHPAVLQSRDEVADLYMRLQVHGEALVLLRENVDETAGQGGEARAACLRKLALFRSEEDDHVACAHSLRKALAVVESAELLSEWIGIRIRLQLASALGHLQGSAESRRLIEDCVVDVENRFGRRSVPIIEVLLLRSGFANRAGRTPDALAYSRDALALAEDILGNGNWLTTNARSQLVGVLQTAGEYGEAVVLAERGIEHVRAAHGEHSTEYDNACLDAIPCLRGAGRGDEAAARIAEVSARLPAIELRSDAVAMSVHRKLADLAYQEAGFEPHILKSIELARRGGKFRELHLARQLKDLGAWRLKRGDAQGALAPLREATEIFESRGKDADPPPEIESPRLAEARIRLGECLTRLGDATGHAIHDRGLEGLEAAFGADDPTVLHERELYRKLVPR